MDRGNRRSRAPGAESAEGSSSSITRRPLGAPHAEWVRRGPGRTGRPDRTGRPTAPTDRPDRTGRLDRPADRPDQGPAATQPGANLLRYNPGMEWDTGSGAGGGGAEDGQTHEESIELFGTNLRLVGRVSLGRFGRLTDMINAASGYLRVHDAQLLKPDGDPTGRSFPEIMVDQDEISFIAQRSEDAPAPESLVGTGFVEDRSDLTIETRTARRFVMFTPGHLLTGSIYLFGQTRLEGFVDATDPRFVAITDVTIRSLADDEVTGEFPFVLINRTQMGAASEIDLEPGDDLSIRRIEWPEVDRRPDPDGPNEDAARP